jgi:hypothetical protein
LVFGEYYQRNLRKHQDENIQLFIQNKTCNKNKSLYKDAEEKIDLKNNNKKKKKERKKERIFKAKN